MVLYVDAKLDRKDGLKYAAGTELHEKVAEVKLCRVAATRMEGYAPPSPLDVIILRAKWRQIGALPGQQC